MLGEWYLPPGKCQAISTITEGIISISHPAPLSSQTRIPQTSSPLVDKSQATQAALLQIRRSEPGAVVSLRQTTRPLEPVVAGLRSLGQGWAGHPSHSRRLLRLRSFARVPAHRRIDDATRWGSRNGSLHIARSFERTRCPRFLSPSNKALATASFPSGMVDRFPEAPTSCSSRKDGLSDGYGPCSTTSGPRLLMSRCPSSTGAQHGA